MHNTDRYGTVILLDLLDTGLINISASGIRNIIYNHANLQNLEKLRQEQTDTLINKLKKLMPNPVVDYILEQNLYT
jgi:nicotinic acid mononucleotide adenylyltransferase